ncbi:MAG TPA: hypothetical protein VMF50_02920 [Candidatus Binataceae bacterium]|nr:hypothetical protein [Candidatus Binataceae bacterium]
MGAIDSVQFEQRETIEHLDGSITEYSYFEPSAEAMDRLVKVLFEEHWRDVVVGPCIEGSVFEVRFTEPPKLTMLDGYLTVNLGPWHFHLCIAEHKGNRSPELARKRQVARVALFETRGQRCGGGRSWGVRMWNGFGEQMTTVFLPNPRLSDEMKPLREPNWERLKLWYDLRFRFLGEQPPASIAEAQAATDLTQAQEASRR